SMGAASAVFRMTRLAVLGRLAASPSANLLTRGFGARALASVSGFAAEGSAFPLTGRLVNEVLGRSQNLDLSQVGGDLASSYLLLGGLRLTGAGANVAAAHLREETLRVAVLQVGMLGGIFLGRRMEEALHLRDAQPGATTLVDSLASLLQFNVGGRLSQGIF